MLRKRASCSGSVPDHETSEVREALRRALLLPDAARVGADYELLDRFTHRADYFSDMPPRDRLRYLKAAKGVELEEGEALFRIGDLADAFYCILYGSVSVVMDLARMPAPTLNEFEEMVSRARVHSSFLNPGGSLDPAQEASYVVRTMKPLDCFGDVGLMLTNQQRTASVVATEKALLMKIDRETFLEMRASNSSREIREKMIFLARVPCVDHWDDDSILRLCGRMEKLVAAYNDVITLQGEPANYFYFVALGACRLVRTYPSPPTTTLPAAGGGGGGRASVVEVASVGAPQFFGSFEVVHGLAASAFSVLVASPTAVLFRVDRVDFRQTMLKDPQTDQAVRADARALADRADASRVRRELDCDARWSQYKRELVDAVLARHRTAHAPLMGPRPNLAAAHRTAREPPLPFLAHASPRARPVEPSSARGAPVVGHPGQGQSRRQRQRQRQRASVDVDASLLPRPPARDSKWIDWARRRAEAIVTGQSGRRIDDADVDVGVDVDDRNSERSGARWSRTARILGGLEGERGDVATAIAAFLDRRTGGD